MVGHERINGTCAPCRSGFAKDKIGDWPCELLTGSTGTGGDSTTTPCPAFSYRDKTGACQSCALGSFLISDKCERCTETLMACCPDEKTVSDETARYLCNQCKDVIPACGTPNSNDGKPWLGVISVTFLSLAVINLLVIAWDYTRLRLLERRQRAKSNQAFSSGYTLTTSLIGVEQIWSLERLRFSMRC